MFYRTLFLAAVTNKPTHLLKIARDAFFIMVRESKKDISHIRENSSG